MGEAIPRRRRKERMAFLDFWCECGGFRTKPKPEAKQIYEEFSARYGASIQPAPSVAVTFFIRFCFVVFGLFGAALVSAPELLFGSQSLLPYWTVHMGETGVWLARSTGVLLLALILGPFVFGVDTRVCALQMLLFLGLTLPLLGQAAFLMPQSTTILCKVQLGVNALLFLINLIIICAEPRALLQTTKLPRLDCFVRFLAILFGLTDLLFATAPAFFFGPEASVPYWTVAFGDVETFYARATGLCGLVVVLGPTLGVTSWSFVKTLCFVLALQLGLVVQAALFSQETTSIFKYHLAAIAMLFMAVVGVVTASWGGWKTATAPTVGASLY